MGTNQGFVPTVTKTTAFAGWMSALRVAHATQEEIMATIHQSDISSFDRCAHAFSLARAGNRGTQTSALAFGTVIHYAILNVFEREYRTGTPWSTALQMAIDSFKYYWSPLHIEELTEPVELWLPRQTFGGMLAKGQESIRWYAQTAREEDSQVIATEIGFQVPIKGTWDDDLGEPHVLAGTIDILKVKPVKRTLTLSIEDLKSGKDYPYLRQNLQFSAYTLATTCREFWTGWRGEDGFGAQGEELYQRFAKAPRRASWISLKSNKVMDAGWRGPDDWARFALAVEQLTASVKADIFPLSLSGENCQYCFTGDTRYWTADGLRTFAETAGTTQRVLSNTGSGGYWVEAPIRRFATDEPVLTVRMARGRAVQEVRATPDHRWLVRVRNDESRTQSRVVTTSELRPGDRLHTLLPSATRLTKVTPSWVGIAAGIVFGDGCSPVSRDASKVTLWGDKCALSQYFPGVLALPVVNGDLKGLQIHSLPRFMKEVPSLEESASYLYGWLAGYFATDGSVGTNGQVSMSSANRAHLELVQAVAARLGIGTHNIASADRVGFNGVTSALYRLNFMTSSLREDFFLLDKHQERFRPEVTSTITWTVTDVVDEGQREDVYCATVPEYENFTLEGFVNVMNCSFRGICAGVGVPAYDHGAP